MAKKLPDLTTYKLWLTEQGYQPSTVEVSLRHIRALSRLDWNLPKPIPKHRHAHVRRYLLYVSESGRNPLGRSFLQAVKTSGLRAASNITKQGSREKTLLGSHEWTTLRSKLRRGDDTSKLLVAYMQSPHRITKFLRLRAHEITEDDVADKISREWLQACGGRRTLFKVLCSTERCAYYRMRRRLQDICEKLEYDADFDTLYKSFHGMRAA